VRPIEHTFEALNEGDDSNLVLAGDAWPPAGDNWFLFSDILQDPGVITGFVGALLATEAGGRRDVAGSYLASGLSGMVAGVPAGALIAAGRAWPLEPQGIAVHLHPDGWFDGMALRSAALWVLSGDPDAGHADVTVLGSADELRERLAGEIVRVVDPLFAAVRTATRYPTRSMWGALADGIAGMALWRDRKKGGLDPEVWDRANEFLDTLQEQARLLKARPTLARVSSSAGCAQFAVKGTCCLYFKTVDGKPDPEGDGYCGGCPFRSEQSRSERWSAWLEEEAAAAT
jgi:hypothetical protein